MTERIKDFKLFSQVTDARWYPRYHLAAPFGWCNDPNGFCFYGGKYHFFYQHHPYEAQWGPMHWGHAISDDLAYWKHLPIALKPDAPYDEGGCFSGSAIEHDGKLWLMYTGNVAPDESRPAQTQALAFSEDGVNFQKFEGNPILLPPASDDIFRDDFRDPKVWQHGGKFYAVIGARSADMQQGLALLYKSDDLIHWDFVNISARSEGLGAMWECPNFAEIDGKDVLVFSPMDLDTTDGKFFHDKVAGVLIGKLNYTTGIFKHGDFQYLDKGFDFYAPQITQTPDGRTIMIGWLTMWFAELHEAADGWAGQMTIPRELHVLDGKIISTPARELEHLRKWRPVVYENLLLEKATTLDGISGDACELELTIDAAKSKRFSVAVRVGEGEQTVMTYDAGKFTFDRTQSGAVIHEIHYDRPDPFDTVADSVRTIKLAPRKKLQLQIFIDRSSVEVFINGGKEVISARIYPRRTSQGIVFTPLDEVLAIDSVTLHKLDFGLPHPRIKDTPVNLREQFPFLKD